MLESLSKFRQEASPKPQGELVNSERSGIVTVDNVHYLTDSLLPTRLYKITGSKRLPDLLKALDNYTSEHPGEPISDYVLELFPRLAEIAVPQLPEKAPELWSDRISRFDTPFIFLRRIYEPWLDDPSLRPLLRSIDRPLYVALAQQAKRHGVPEDLEPFFSNRNHSPASNDAQLEELGAERPSHILQRVPDRREAERLYAAARNREK